MAKRIKTLKCPQCDSVHISEKRPDFYECQSCGTDFFLLDKNGKIVTNLNLSTLLEK